MSVTLTKTIYVVGSNHAHYAPDVSARTSSFETARAMLIEDIDMTFEDASASQREVIESGVRQVEGWLPPLFAQVVSILGVDFWIEQVEA